MRLVTACSGVFSVMVSHNWISDKVAHIISSRYTTKAFGPIMAKAATLTIVEAENIVPVGSIDPNDVSLPGIFVDRIVPATDEKHIENKKLRSGEASATGSARDAAQIQRELIGRRAAKELKPGFYVNLGVGMYMQVCGGSSWLTWF
jgi:3-oxoacid CoA-transferase